MTEERRERPDQTAEHEEPDGRTDGPDQTDGHHEPDGQREMPQASGRRAAHERLSTGGLARWMRACALHPWRVILSWLGIIVGLIVLVLAVGGSLKDEFEIP